MEIAKVRVYGTQAVTVSVGDIPVGIIGATVSLEFSPEWAGLTKNVMFLGAKDVAMLDVQDSVYLPPEVVSSANLNVKMGICGVDANKKMVIPTLWADLGVVKPGTPVNLGYDPQLPVWAQLLGMIGDLRNLTTEARDNLVNAINEAALSGGGGINEHALQEAINKALDQAKASGEFDGEDGQDGVTFRPNVRSDGYLEWSNNVGAPNPAPAKVKGDPGKSAYAYAQEGGYTGTEEEFAEMLAKGSGGGGLSDTEKSLIMSLFKNAAYTADMSATISKLETLWSGGTVEPDIPDLPEADVSQSGSILSIVSGVTVTQSGSVLAIA